MDRVPLPVEVVSKNTPSCGLSDGDASPVPMAPAFTTNAIRTVAIDREDNVWAGTDGGGLYMHSNQFPGCTGTWQKFNQFSPVSTYKYVVIPVLHMDRLLLELS